MSALPGGQGADAGPQLQLAPMYAADLPQVLEIENDVYSHPWTHGNFVDALASGYLCRVLRDARHTLIGYFLLLLAVDEAHLLNISVRRDWQRRGIGRRLLDEVEALARQHGMASILLEVRPSNQRAITIYRRHGYSMIGLRRNYYPAPGGGREDAIVMRFRL